MHDNIIEELANFIEEHANIIDERGNNIGERGNFPYARVWKTGMRGNIIEEHGNIWCAQGTVRNFVFEALC